MTTTPSSTGSSTRHLDESELERVVGGAATPANQQKLGDLVHQDLIGHDAGHDQTAQIAGMIASGAVSAQDAIKAIETNAAHDGKHSADQQLMNLQTTLTHQHNAAASAAIIVEEAKRISSGVASADLGRLVSSGAMTGAAATTLLQNEAHAASPSSLGQAMLGLEKASGGDAAVETELGHMVKAGTVAAASAISTVEAAEKASHHSIDQALDRLDMGAGGNKTIEAEEAKRLQSGAAAADLAGLMAEGRLSGAAATSIIETGAAHTKQSVSQAMLGLEKATGGDAAVETELGHLVKSGAVSAASAISTVEAAEKASHHSIDQALDRLDGAAGGNKTIEAEEAKRLQSGAAAADLAALVAQGKLSGAAAASIIETEAAHTKQSVSQAVLGLEKATAGDAAVEAELGRLVKTGALSVGSAISAIEAAHGKSSPVDALAGLDKAIGGNAAVEAEIAKALVGGLLDGSAEAALARNVTSGKLTPAQALKLAFDAIALDQHQTPGQGPTPLRRAQIQGLGDHLTPVLFEADIVLAKLVSAAQAQAHSNAPGHQQAQQFADLLSGYSTALDVGNALVSIVDELGPKLTAAAMAAGQKIAGMADPSAAMNALMALEQQARKAGVSVDAALTLASIGAGGNNSTIAAEMFGRVQNGASAADLSALLNAGKLTGDVAASIIMTAARQVDSSVGDAVIALEAAAGGNAGIEKAIGRLVASGDIAVADAIAAVESTAAAAHHSVDAALINLQAGAGGSNAEIAQQEANRLQDGTSVQELSNAWIFGRMKAVDVAAILEAEAKHALPVTGIDYASTALSAIYGLTHDDTVKSHLTAALKGGLLDGSAERVLASAIANGTLSNADVKDLVSAAIKLAQQTPGSLVLPGVAEAEIVLAKLESAVTDAMMGALASGSIDALNRANAFRFELTQTYGLAIDAGKTLMPMVNELGPQLAADALSAGQKLAAISDPTTGGESAIVAKLMQEAQQAGHSVDAALTLAAFTASGHSEVLKLVLTSRLMNGAAEKDIATLAATGHISADDAVNILTSEVGVLAAGSSMNAALGFNRDVATAFVLAKLDLAAAAMHADPTAGDFVMQSAQALRSTIERGHSPQITTGLGAVLGLLSANPTMNAAAIANAQSVLNNLMPAAVAKGLVDTAMNSDGTNMPADPQQQLTDVAQQQVQDLIKAFESAKALGDLELKLTTADPKKPMSPEFSASLKTYSFTERNVAVGVDAMAFGTLGGGFNVVVDANATAMASAEVNATQVTLQSAAQASASATFDLGGRATVIELVQAIAAGAVVAGVTGVALKGNVAVGISASVNHTEQGKLANGLDGMESTTLTEGLVAGAEGNASVGLKNEVKYGALAGAYLSASQTGSLTYGGVTLGGGATVTTGEVGAAADVTAEFKDGDINISVSGTLAGEVFGLTLTGNLKIPTGRIVDELRTIGSAVPLVATGAANAIAQEATSIANKIGGGATDAANKVGGAFEDAGNAIGNAFGF